MQPLAEPEAVELFCQPAPACRGRRRRSASSAGARRDAARHRARRCPREACCRPTQILERLSQRLDLLKGGRDADPRQRTLRSTIEWSHDLLDADEQRLFARLAVFAGGCTLETAERVADADLDTLQSLVEKSLVRHTDDRYWMYETIRGFARERWSHPVTTPTSGDGTPSISSRWLKRPSRT